MLAIQPVSMNTYSQKVNFQRNNKKILEDDREFFEKQKQEIEELISDSKLPKGMKKFLNAANIVTDGLIAGFTVACATIASATCGKNTYGRLSKNKFVQKTVKYIIKPVGEYINKGFKLLKHQAANLVRKIFGQEKGQKIVDFAKAKIASARNLFNKLNPFETPDKFDKAAAKTATGLGIGAGTASAYAKAVEKSEQDDEE